MLQCATAGPYQLLGHPLHQCSETDVVILPVVIHVLHELGNGLCVSLRLKLIAFALLWTKGDRDSLLFYWRKKTLSIVYKSCFAHQEFPQVFVVGDDSIVDDNELCRNKN